MEEIDFAAALMNLADMFIECSKILDSENEAHFVSKCFNDCFDFEKNIPKKKRSKRLKRESFDIILEGFFWKNCLKRKAKKEMSSMASKKHKSNISNNIMQEQLDFGGASNQARGLFIAFDGGYPGLKLRKPDLPTPFKEAIEKMEGGEVKLVIQKELTETDLKPNHGRLSIPRGKTQEKNFLTPLEESLLDVREGENKKHLGMSMSVLGPNLKLYDNMCFKKWEMKTTNVYNITRGWNKLVTENHLQVKDNVQLWSFRNRTHHQLYFALIKL